MRFRKIIIISILLATFSVTSSFSKNLNDNNQGNQEKVATTVVLQGLNKITAKTFSLKTAVGSQIIFGNLKIDAHKCWKSPPEERPENKVLLEITDNSNQNKIFYGWMFSSSPSISSLEHPIYDVTVISCEFDKNNEQ